MPLMNLIYANLLREKNLANVVDLSGFVCACVFLSKVNMWKMNWFLFVYTMIIPCMLFTSRI